MKTYKCSNCGKVSTVDSVYPRCPKCGYTLKNLYVENMEEIKRDIAKQDKKTNTTLICFVIIIIIAIVLIFRGCLSSPESGSSLYYDNNSIKTSDDLTVKELTIREKLNLANDFTPCYDVVEDKSLNYTDKSGNTIRRHSYKIILPKGLTKENINDNFEHLTISSFEKEGNKSISISAYNAPSEINGSYTIAMYEFCPRGNWELAGLPLPLDEWDSKIYYSPIYINPESTISVNSKVTLKTDTRWNKTTKSWEAATHTKMSNNPTDFNDDKVTLIPNGTTATILEIYEKQQSPTFVWVAYKVKTSNGKTGWILNDNIELSK